MVKYGRNTDKSVKKWQNYGFFYSFVCQMAGNWKRIRKVCRLITKVYTF